jgi:hypothetical protein
LGKRIRMAAESILENESILEGTDDSGASALLDWGVARAQSIAGDTAGVEDDEEAEELSYPRMRALRQMLDGVKNLYNSNLEFSDGKVLLAEIIEFAPIVYGPKVQLPQHIYWYVFKATLTGDNGEKIKNLRALFENNINPQGD